MISDSTTSLQENMSLKDAYFLVNEVAVIIIVVLLVIVILPD